MTRQLGRRLLLLYNISASDAKGLAELLIKLFSRLNALLYD